MNKCAIYPNAYYNYLKNRKEEKRRRKKQVLQAIEEIYHEHKGVDGYRRIKVYLERRGIYLSNLTVFKYMKELKLKSITRRKKMPYKKGSSHKVFKNILNQKFEAEKINEKWVIDFTYLYLKDGSVHYNCTILDLYDRSVVASKTAKNITSELAINTVKAALKNQGKAIKNLLLHSDRGSQFTSKEFTKFCEQMKIKQSMSRAGCPFDNSPMERYFNTLKTELIYLHVYQRKEQLYEAVQNFAYIFYNHVRPHSYNKFKTPFQARILRHVCYNFA